MFVRALVAAFAVAAAGHIATEARASTLISFGQSPVGLRVDGNGHALVSVNGRRILAWGAINARPPTRGVPQIAFKLRYGGSMAGGTCGAYDGPALPWLVTACKAPDGTYWAIQRWERLRPNYGGARGRWEVRLSHWSGDTAHLDVFVDWSYRRFDHLYGSYRYQGQPVYGFSATRTGSPLDAYGRNLYLDTLDSRYGAGWRRENSFLSQGPNGTFCYGFYPHGRGKTGKGTLYRITVIGPGVSPDVGWQGQAPGPYNASLDATANAQQRSLFAAGGRCRPH
jgi:hypothetical protein